MGIPFRRLGAEVGPRTFNRESNVIKGDISLYTDTAGGEHVAVVTETHDDGSVDLARLPTSHRRVPRSAVKAAGTFFDPSWIDEVVVPSSPELTAALAADSGFGGTLSSVPMQDEGSPEQPVENPAHGDPADVTPDEPRDEGDDAVEEKMPPLRQFTEGEDGSLQEVLPAQPTAHGAPADVTPDEPQAG